MNLFTDNWGVDTAGREIEPARRRNTTAFTIIEVMIALFMFAMILTAIYATWFAILKGTKSGLTAAAEVQRSRIAMHTLQDAFLTVQLFNENMKHYWFITENKGDFAAVSMVSRLPASFPGVGRYGNETVVRRVSFFTQPGSTGGVELVMTQAPILLNTNASGVEAYSLVLARDVSVFKFDYYDEQKKNWVEDWLYTNALPRAVRVTLGLGHSGSYSSKPQDVVVREIAIPAAAIAGVQAGPAPGTPGGIPGQPGGVPPPPNRGVGAPNPAKNLRGSTGRF